LMTDNDVINACSPYTFILPFDPTHSPHINHDFVVIHPHGLNTAVDLSLSKYRFLLNVVRLYSRGLVDISPFITISIEA
jgi:hypothetical protein